jgi:hypothetical protein
MWMILLFKAYCEFGACCLCHCAITSLVTLDLKTTQLNSQRTCRSYYRLHNINESNTKVNGATSKKGKKALLEFPKSNHQA